MSVESSDAHNHVDEAFHVPTSSELTVVKKKIIIWCITNKKHSGGGKIDLQNLSVVIKMSGYFTVQLYCQS